MLENSQLGKKSAYQTQYAKSLLFPIPRQKNRQHLNINLTNPGFYGVDIWNHYEISWLDLNGKPHVAIGIIQYDALSPNLIESKSMKLYFNSFNNTKLKDINEFKDIVHKDLSEAIGSKIIFDILSLNSLPIMQNFEGVCLDNLDIECNVYETDSTLLTVENNHETHEKIYSNLLKSNCLVTHQPDWASIFIEYTGTKINHANLLKYIVSFRNHNGFHEQCVEQIFTDIQQRCKPSKLTVYARYTRRGGLDINPFRTTEKDLVIADNLRLIRQ